MRVLNESKLGTVRQADHSNTDPVANLRNVIHRRNAAGDEALVAVFNIIHAPVNNRTTVHITIGVQRQLIASHLEADIERLVKVGIHAKQLRPASFTRCEIVGWIYDCAESVESDRHIPSIPYTAWNGERNVTGLIIQNYLIARYCDQPGGSEYDVQTVSFRPLIVPTGIRGQA